jgi:WD40 repeat protein/serine/threonine protein kinase
MNQRKGAGSEDASKDTVLEGSAASLAPAETVAVPGSNETIPPAAPGVAAAEEAVAAEWANGDVILDLYEVAGLLGEGGMGKVYRVRHRGWNLDLAVKSPRPDFFQTEEQKANFVRECETWIDLGLHPHMVSCYYVRTLGGIPRVFAEYVEGGSLADWIKSGKLYEGGPERALERILDVAIQFAWGLGYAHERGLIHQDVKPANVMLTPEGVAKVTDFGLAQARPVRQVEAPDGKGGTVLVRGRGMTPAYCSPEQASGAELSRKTDIWSWGVSVLEMFTGEVTWVAGQAASQALDSYAEAEPDGSRIPRMPQQLVNLLRRCFEHEPSARPKDMPVVVEQLQACYREVAGEEYAREEPKPAELLADALNNRAVSLLDLGKRDEAEKLFEEALKADPHHVEAAYNWGLVLWRTGRLTDDALVRQLEEVRTSHENEWRDEYYLGLVHIERGDSEAAVKVLEEAKKMAPEESEVQRAFGTAEAGRAHWRRCVCVFEMHTADLAFSLDERWGLSWDERWHGKMLRLWNLAAGQCVRVFEGHTDWVNSATISPDGRRALSWSDDKTLRLWDLATGGCTRVFEGHQAAMTSVAISPDWRRALSASEDKTLRLWDLATGQCVRVFEGHPAVVTSVAISPGWRSALSGSNDKTLRLWDLATGQCVRDFEGHTEAVCSVVISPDGCWGISKGDATGELRKWDLATGECLWALKEHPRERCMAVSRDWSWGLWVHFDYQYLELRELATGRRVREMSGYRFQFKSVRLSPDECWALSGCSDCRLRLWELATGRCVRTFEGHTKEVNSVSISPDGRWALSGSDDKTLRLWDISTGQCVRVFEGHTESVYSVVISPDGRWAHSKSSDNTLRLWEYLAAGPTAPFAVTRPRSSVEVAGVSAQAAQAIDGARDLLGRGQPHAAFEMLTGVWRLAEFERHPEVLELIREAGLCGTRIALAAGWCVRSLAGSLEGVFAVAMGREGGLAVSGSLDNRLRIWELATGKCMRVIEERRLSSDTTFVAISPDGRWILSGGCLGKKLMLWELATGKCARVFEGHAKSVKSVVISPDGRAGLSGSDDNTLRLWNLATGQCVHVFEGHTESVNSVVISQDARLALSGSSDQTLRLWDLASGHCLRTFQGHGGYVRSVAISPDGRWGLSGAGKLDVSDELQRQVKQSEDLIRRVNALLAQGKESAAVALAEREGPKKVEKEEKPDNSLRLWDLTTGKCLRVFEGHTEWINSVTISPDGRWGLSGSNDRTLRLWDLATGRCERIFEGHAEAVNSAVMSPDGRWVLSGSSDRTLRLWELAWNYEFPERVDWDPAVQPHLASFLALHPPRRSLLRRLVPTWSEGELQRLLTDLRYRGFGWLRPEGVRKELEKMTRDWKGLPNLPWKS